MRRYTYTCMNMTHNVHMSRQQWPVPLPLLVGKYRSQLVSLVVPLQLLYYSTAVKYVLHTLHLVY